MAGIEKLLGASGVIEQLLLWNVVGQVVTNLMSPAFNALQQEALEAHPNMVITPDILAHAVTQTFMSKGDAIKEAAKSGVDASRFDVLLKLADVRLTPADLAEAVLRSYVTRGDAEQQAKLQGITAARFETMTLLAGDGIGPQQAAEALRRGLIHRKGAGPKSTSYEQAIAESRLHDKWADVLEQLTHALLSPPDAAEAVVRGFLPTAKGEAVAALSGVDAATFATMVDLAGDAPSPTQLAEALRRGIIPEDSGSPGKPGFAQGIRQGRLADKWTDMIKALAKLWPTPVDALEARLVGQVTDKESKELYEKFGGDLQYWQLLFDTRGESPSPLELIEMANRGFIPWSGAGPEKTTYEQGFNEGRHRDKWRSAYRKFATYVPPESVVTGLLSRGTITETQAAKWLAQAGMDALTIKAFIEDAHLVALSEYRGATVTMVLSAYYEQILTATEATPILESLHVSPTAVKFMLEYEDRKRDFTAINSAISRIRTLYASRKILLKTARDGLIQVGLKSEAIDQMLAAWELENSISVKVLTESQIADAFQHDIMTYAEALIELGNIGYTAFDSWVLLSIKAKGALPDKPPQGPAALQGAVIPGTT